MIHHHYLIQSITFFLIRKRRKLKSSTLHCRHCGEVYTSKVSFKLHQQRHTLEARQILKGEVEDVGGFSDADHSEF